MSAEMCFMRRTVGYSLLNHKRDEEIIRDLQIMKITGLISVTV
jgi:hypothetical protein